MKKDKLRILDLFAGAGGLGLGFEQAGYEVVGALEIDKWCCDTISFNNPHTKVIQKDIIEISENEIRNNFKNIDVVVGGPPCQGFSISNRNGRDPKDPRNSLFREFIRIVSYLNPKAVVLENVKGLTSFKTSNGEKVINIIENEFLKLGYRVETHILNASRYGVPQMRERVFVIGVKTPKTDVGFRPPETHGSQGSNLFSQNRVEQPVTAWQAISDLPQITEAVTAGTVFPYKEPPHNPYQAEMRKGSKAIYNHEPMKHSKKIIERLKHISFGNDKSSVPSNLMPAIRNGNGKLAEKIYDQNHRRIRPDKISYTIAASFYANFIHPYLPRNITAREGARIQSFPDWYIFQGKKTVVSSKLLTKEGRNEENYLSQYNQIGNAVPPKLAYAIAKHLNLILNYGRPQVPNTRRQHQEKVR